jgi:AraC-like DNA-binding protein/mannose-6-phosphate isomerase-like protein (cupin superfamily)
MEWCAMKIVPVKVDSSNKESMPFKDITFLVDSWTDAYDTFIDETLNCHWHPEFEFSVLVSGKLDFYLGGIHMQMTEGDCIFINSNTMHTAKQAQGSNGSVIKGAAFPASLFVGNTNSTVYRKYFESVMAATMQGFVISGELDHAREMSSLILDVNGLNESEFGYELKCLSLLSRLWEVTLTYILSYKPNLLEQKGNRKYEERAKKILTFIHENYAENITIDLLSEHASISRSECFRCFKHFTNKKPVEYINEYRLSIAAKLLMESGLSVTEVGSACGFENSGYFGRLFKDNHGISPGKYRKGSK